MSFDWATFGSAISGAIVGGLITGFFTLRAANNSFDHQRQQSEENEEKLIRGLLNSIHDEIETLNDRYQETAGSHVEVLKEGDPFMFYYPVMNDYFTVYNGNSFLIGRIQTNDLRKQIVKTYALAKGMVDSYRMNNDLVSKYEHSTKIFEATKEEIHQLHAQAHYNSLCEYAVVLKASHKELKGEISKLLREFRKNGVLSEVGS